MRVRLFASALFVFAFTSAPAPAADQPEPKYEGKPLDYWVQRFQKAEDDKNRDDATEALRAFGPDAAPALPTLIEMLADHSPKYRARVLEIIAAIGPKAQDARPVIVKLLKEKKLSRYDGSIAAVVAISSDPKDAVRALIPLMEIEETNRSVYYALCDLGPAAQEAVPAIRTFVLKELAAAEKNQEKSLSNLRSLADLGSDAVPLLVEILDAPGRCGQNEAFECLEKLGPKATKAVPALLKLLKTNSPVTCGRAASLLWAIEKHPAAVTAFADLLKMDPGYSYTLNPTRPEDGGSVVTRAIKFLGDIGPEAKAALPQLREVVAVGCAFWLFTEGTGSLFTACRPTRVAPAVADYAGGVYLVAPPVRYEPVDSRLWNAAARIEAGRAAAEAIAKIEAKPKK
jgi:hypothetical protein